MPWSTRETWRARSPRRPGNHCAASKHAYLDDPNGHEVSLYWAGAKCLPKQGK